jgi:hypothetical protein
MIETKLYKRDGSDYEQEPITNFILEQVAGGIKAVELVARTIKASYETIFIPTETEDKEVNRQIRVNKYTQENYSVLIDQLVTSGDIVELEYVLPQMEHHVKSFYMPRGTNLNVVRKDRVKERKGDYLV